jgi:hypothetical protein
MVSPISVIGHLDGYNAVIDLYCLSALPNLTGIIPNLDSIAEFRIISSNADAEYGGYSATAGTRRMVAIAIQLNASVPANTMNAFSIANNCAFNNAYCNQLTIA